MMVSTATELGAEAFRVENTLEQVDEVRGVDRPNIPVRNWWHMLLYAWDLVELDGLFNAKWESAPDLRELLTRILVDLTNRQIRRGLRGDYVDRSEALKTVRGGIDFNRTLSDLLLYKGQLHCEYQEYSLNVPRNQIIATTLQRQFREGFSGSIRQRVDDLKADVGRIVRTLDEIDRIRLDRSVIANEMHMLGPNEREYKLMLRVCEMLYRPAMPMDDDTDAGQSFQDWLQKRKHEVFERFVANFCKLRLTAKGWDVSAQSTLRWNETGPERVGDVRLPTMRPDIVLRRDGDTENIVVIDTKWYSSVASEHYGNLTVHSANLYQMYAYLASQDHESDAHRKATGILLYGQTREGERKLRTRIDEHPFWVETLDLMQEWEKIEEDLVRLVGETVAVEHAGQV